MDAFRAKILDECAFSTGAHSLSVFPVLSYRMILMFMNEQLIWRNVSMTQVFLSVTEGERDRVRVDALQRPRSGGPPLQERHPPEQPEPDELVANRELLG